MPPQTKFYARSPIRHMLRQIAAVTNPQMGYRSVEDVDSEISSMLLQGYRLFATHYLGAQKDPSANMEYFGVLYIFQLEQSELERMKNDAKKVPEKVE
jgi:hypothetical protein